MQLNFLKTKPADYFEHFVMELLSKMGYGGTDENNFEVV
jgi:restriction system protein